MIYNPSLEKPKGTFVEATISQLYYIINTVGLLELFIKITTNYPDYRKTKYKKADLVYTNTDSINEGDVFHIYSIKNNGKQVEYWYRIQEAITTKKSYPVNGIPEVCPICKSPISIIKGKGYCNNSTCPGILFTVLKRYLVLGAKLELTMSEYSVLKKLVFMNKVKCVSDLYHVSLPELESIWYYETRDESDAELFYNKIQSTLGNVEVTNYLYSLPFFKEDENYNIYISTTFMAEIKTMSNFLNWLHKTDTLLNSDTDSIQFTDIESKISQEFYELLIDYFSVEDNVQEALYLEELKLFK